MVNKGFVRKFKPLEILTDEQLKRSIEALWMFLREQGSGSRARRH